METSEDGPGSEEPEVTGRRGKDGPSEPPEEGGQTPEDLLKEIGQEEKQKRLMEMYRRQQKGTGPITALLRSLEQSESASHPETGADEDRKRNASGNTESEDGEEAGEASHEN